MTGDRTSRLRILVLGYVVRRPLGGGTWPTLQYALGLLRLGHDVWFLEDSEDYGCCYDPSRHITDEDPTYGLAYAKGVFERTGLGDRWAYYDAHQNTWHGPAGNRVPDIAAAADLLLNVSGINPIRPWLEQVPHRAYIDIDPAFEQVRQLTDQHRRERALQHSVFFTDGENIPTGKAEVPDDGIGWQTIRQPVVMDAWPVTPADPKARFTTVMLWDSYEPREHEGYRFGMKSESFGPYLDLPQRTGPIFELALGSPNAPRSMLRDKGWSIADPLEITKDPWTYQRYIQQSKGEFTVAKHGYVVSNCGWFSERSAHYLASGRPVITQETGFSEWLPTGAGLFSFSSPEGVITALEELDRDYSYHCREARALAEQYFDSDKVLSRLVDLAVASSPGTRQEPPLL
ncbi:MAG: glycosyltransferase [Planctomycetota bacterium]|jgi:hypothetical protein